MTSKRKLLGVVKDGLIVPNDGVQLPEGAEVELTIVPLQFTPEEQAEFEFWDQAGNEAWAMIYQCEAEDDHVSR